jgi:hypothetical protein
MKGMFFSKYPLWEPIREDYIITTDGNKEYVVKRWRKDIIKPLRYQILDATINFSGPVFQIQTYELKSQMLFEADRLMFDEKGIEEFLKAYENFISDISFDDFKEITESIEDPMLSYGVLKEEALEAFLTRYYSCLPKERLNRIWDFFRENSEYSDVMNILIRQVFCVVNGGFDISSDQGPNFFSTN